jgi:hypothetical protein
MFHLGRIGPARCSIWAASRRLRYVLSGNTSTACTAGVASAREPGRYGPQNPPRSAGPP